MKKKFTVLILILIGILVGCTSQNIIKTNPFDIQIATDKASQYVYRIQQGDLEGAKEISSPNIAKTAKISEAVLPIIGYTLDKVTEASDGAYFNMLIVKGDSKKARCDLDKWIIKVETNDKNEYKITEVKSATQKQVFVNDGALTMVANGDTESQVVTRLKDLPRAVYSKSQKPMISKENIPLNEFKVLSINFTGDKIAFTTENEKNSFIGVALLEDARAVFSTMGTTQNVSPNDLEKIFEKPVAQKIVYCDILENTKVNSFVFSEEGDALITAFTASNGSKGINIYKIPDGDLAPLNLTKIFSLDKYEMEYIGSNKSAILINVKKKTGVNGINQELLGEYLVNLNNNTIDKI